MCTEFIPALCDCFTRKRIVRKCDFSTVNRHGWFYSSWMKMCTELYCCFTGKWIVKKYHFSMAYRYGWFYTKLGKDTELIPVMCGCFTGKWIVKNVWLFLLHCVNTMNTNRWNRELKSTVMRPALHWRVNCERGWLFYCEEARTDRV